MCHFLFCLLVRSMGLQYIYDAHQIKMIGSMSLDLQKNMHLKSRMMIERWRWWRVQHRPLCDHFVTLCWHTDKVMNTALYSVDRQTFLSDALGEFCLRHLSILLEFFLICCYILCCWMRVENIVYNCWVVYRIFEKILATPISTLFLF